MVNRPKVATSGPAPQDKLVYKSAKLALLNGGFMLRTYRVRRKFARPVWEVITPIVILAFRVLQTQGHAYSSLAEAYAALSFYPFHPSNSVMVLFSDPHMNVWTNVLPLATNIEPLLVNVINNMNPPPVKIIVAGDTSTTLSPVPGWKPRAWSMNYGTNEMLHWLNAIRAITNVPQGDIIWIPGNHDQLYFETNAETFRQIYPMMREIFADGPARWWILSGPAHSRSLRVYQIGRSWVCAHDRWHCLEKQHQRQII